VAPFILRAGINLTDKGGRLVGIVRSQTQATEFGFVFSFNLQPKRKTFLMKLIFEMFVIGKRRITLMKWMDVCFYSYDQIFAVELIEQHLQQPTATAQEVDSLDDDVPAGHREVLYALLKDRGHLHRFTTHESEAIVSM
jgi:hypothetical protein